MTDRQKESIINSLLQFVLFFLMLFVSKLVLTQTSAFWISLIVSIWIKSYFRFAIIREWEEIE
ncbi:hypothetical protein B8A44_07625 [Dolosigranulum pigrum]|uniref:Uncharacterized protein n=1 Tax=Dolosigranulum pigrum TaxID=29394 RepID=A0A328KNU1_9LACT|nr:hypothetical protein B8A44_07625 [Dolosigranulum pigrum]